jgi:hypothetical protein
LVEKIRGEPAATLRAFGRPKLVKVLALLWVTEDVIGRLDFFELLWIATFIRVVLHSKFTVSFFDVFG